MAIKLTDIIGVMKSKWTYGDKAFGYKEEFNDNHDTQYPSLLITPPTSVFPEVTKMNGWENYTFEIYFSDLYNRTAQANETIEQRWENLQDLATEWLDNFLKNYQGSAPIQAFLDEEDVVLARVKEAFNDQLVQIKMTFSWRVMSKCFIPVSTYPNQIADLALWLRADSNVTFSIPTKKVSAIGDGSGSGNNVGRSASTGQPLRYSYGGGALDKTRLEFDGTSDYFETDASSPILKEFTIFEVSKVDVDVNETSKLLYYKNLALENMQVGSANNKLSASVIDDSGNGSTLSLPTSDTSSYHIGMCKLDDKTLTLEYNNTLTVSATDAAYDNTQTYNAVKLLVGSSGVAPSIPVVPSDYYDYLKGGIQEIIIFNRVLTSFEQDKMKDYLNKKYKIY